MISFNKIKIKIFFLIRAYKFSRRPKVFCIGRNKTGTTSMKYFFDKLGYHLASQKKGELFLKDWKNNNFDKLFKFIKYGGEAFQDVPFSLPYTYKMLNEKFPNSKFILTIRDSPEAWYQSVLNYDSKMFGNNNVPNAEDLKNSLYRYKGWAWELNKAIYKTPDNDIYNEKLLKEHYIKYNNDVINYFKNKPNKLLVVNLNETDAAYKISKFLDNGITLDKIPWSNKTKK